ncbi:MAG: cobalamin biosynthesis protein CobN, partial [Desulfobacteraceae bacterium]|nr:cobalamin biosynthesis protein CobN [Desulfobacteraceae bacterium]
MKSYTLNYFSATSMEIPSLSQGIELFMEMGNQVRVHAKTQIQLFDESRIKSFVDHAIKSDIIIITLHGGKESCPALEPLIKALDDLKAKNKKTPWFHIQPTGGDEDALDLAREHSTKFGTPVWDKINAYLKHGGPINYKYLLCYVQGLLFDFEPEQLEEP